MHVAVSQQTPVALLDSFSNSQFASSLLGFVFLNLNQHDLQATASVSQTFRRLAVTTLNVNAPTSIKKFTQHLIAHLGTFPKEQEALTKIINEVAIQHFANLPKMKDYILRFKAQLINVIKNLDAATIQRLSGQLRPPNFMEDIFKMADFERQIADALAIQDLLKKNVALKDISVELATCGYFDRALEVYESMDRERTKQHALWCILGITTKKNLNRAIDIARSQDHSVASSLETITECLITQAAFKEAKRVITMIPEECSNMRRRLFIRVVHYSILNKFFDEVIAILELIPFKDDSYLKRVSNELRKAGEIEKADAVLKMIPEEDFLSKAYRIATFTIAMFVDIALAFGAFFLPTGLVYLVNKVASSIISTWGDLYANLTKNQMT